MKTRNIDINYINKKPLCITIGNFDGIHLGHKYIINTMVNESRMNDLYPTVLSFNPFEYIFLSGFLNSGIITIVGRLIVKEGS